MTHSDIKARIAALSAEVDALDKSGQYEGYDLVCEYLDGAFDRMDKVEPAERDEPRTLEDMREGWALDRLAVGGRA